MSAPKDLLSEALADDTLPEPVRRALSSGKHLERITLDAEGRWWHEGDPIDHPRIADLFHRSIERTPGGTFVLHIPPFTYPIEVRDTPYFVRQVTIAADATPPVHLRLSDGSEEALDLHSLRYVPERGFYCRVKAGAFAAHFCRPAYYALAEYVQEEGSRYSLVLGKEHIPIAVE